MCSTKWGATLTPYRTGDLGGNRFEARYSDYLGSLMFPALKRTLERIVEAATRHADRARSNIG